MIHGNAVQRAEIRRLSSWFDAKLLREVAEKLLGERMIKRIVSREAPTRGCFVKRCRSASNISTMSIICSTGAAGWRARGSASPISRRRRSFR